MRAFARRHGLAGRGILVAVSGGVDSVVLAHALARLARPLGLRVAVGHVHHGLRGEAADADEAFVQDLAAKLGIPFARERIAPAALRGGGPSRTRPTLQEAARELRYGALGRIAGELGLAHVATAHHADDQAETVLLRLLRGTGPDGLRGIPERSADGRVVRPLLAASRAEIAAWAVREGLAWREDLSNASPDYARNRLRRDLVPVLRQFSPRLVQRIAELAEAQGRDSEWIGAEVERECAARVREEPDGLWIARRGWSELPDALARRLARRALVLSGAGRDVTRTHLLRTVSFLRTGRTGGRIELPGGLELACERTGFRLRKARGAGPSRVLG